MAIFTLVHNVRLSRHCQQKLSLPTSNPVARTLRLTYRNGRKAEAGSETDNDRQIEVTDLPTSYGAPATNWGSD